MNRRRFIALIGASLPGLWLDGTGLIQIPKRMVIALSGQCSFCGKNAKEVFGLAGVAGRSVRICNECIDICLEIYRDDLLYGEYSPTPVPPPPPPDVVVSSDNAEAFDFVFTGLARDRWVPRTKEELEGLMAELGKLLNQPATDMPKTEHHSLVCSFCDRKAAEVQKLVAGPQIYICELCVGDALAILNLHR